MVSECLKCGAAVPQRTKSCGGNQPAFCSENCRLLRKRETTRQWIEAHKEQKLEKDAQYRKAYLASHPEYFREHYARNKERRKQESLAWYRENTEYAAERQRAYEAKRLAEFPDHVRAIGRRNANKRRAIKKQVFIEVVDPRVVFERDKGVCGICRHEVDVTSPWEVDHIVPISKGGTHCYANVQLSHRKCNRSKAARLVA